MEGAVFKSESVSDIKVETKTTIRTVPTLQGQLWVPRRSWPSFLCSNIFRSIMSVNNSLQGLPARNGHQLPSIPLKDKSFMGGSHLPPQCT